MNEDEIKKFIKPLLSFVFIIVMGIVGMELGQDIFSNKYLGVIMSIAAAGALILYSIDKHNTK